MPKLDCKHQRVEFLVHRAGGHRWIYSTCQECGMEWTVSENVPDLTQTVSVDEILEVHAELAGNKTLAELIG